MSLSLMFFTVPMTGILVHCFRHGHRVPRRTSVGWRGAARSVALAISLAVCSIPAGASAKSVETSTSLRAAPVAASAPISVGAARAQGYAARQASARGLEKFEGGDTTVVIGGGLLVVILVVVLIVVLI